MEDLAGVGGEIGLREAVAAAEDYVGDVEDVEGGVSEEFPGCMSGRTRAHFPILLCTGMHQWYGDDTADEGDDSPDSKRVL